MSQPTAPESAPLSEAELLSLLKQRRELWAKFEEAPSDSEEEGKQDAALNESASQIASFFDWNLDFPNHLATLDARAQQHEKEVEALQTRIAELERFEPQLMSMEGPEMRIKVARQLMQNMVDAFLELNSKGQANYTESEFKPASGNGPSVLVTVQFSDKPTSHQLRRKAEEALAAVERERDALAEAVRGIRDLYVEREKAISHMLKCEPLEEMHAKNGVGNATADLMLAVYALVTAAPTLTPRQEGEGETNAD